MNWTDYFSPNYKTARERFLVAVQRLDFRLDSQPFEGLGPTGEPLAMDIAVSGNREAERVVIVSSGLHGVEGFFGSAVQLAWLETRAPDWSPPPNAAIVLVHALNPFGFAWVRRWNENNVDLNRNFLDDRNLVATDPKYEESRAVYQRLMSFLNPASAPSRWEPYVMKVIFQTLSEGYHSRLNLPKEDRPSLLAVSTLCKLGLREMKKSLPVGQYQYAHGLFYGGAELEKTTQVIRDKLPGWVREARLVLHIDYHTGLGKYADYKLLTVDDKGSKRERWLSAHFGERIDPVREGDTAYPARGLMAEYFTNYLLGKQYHCLSAEFGTYSPSRVLGALRAENRAHHFDTRGSRSYDWAKQQLREAFCPAAGEWRTRVVEQGQRIIDEAIRICFKPIG
jgi:hypothetical protein